MTTSTDFESQLDYNPSDWTLRSIYADWLEEQGNPRAESMRWMVANEKCPRKSGTAVHVVAYESWDWWRQEQAHSIKPSSKLPDQIFDSLSDKHWESWRESLTRIAAELDLHNALVKAGEFHCALIEEKQHETCCE